MSTLGADLTFGLGVYFAGEIVLSTVASLTVEATSIVSSSTASILAPTVRASSLVVRISSSRLIGRKLVLLVCVWVRSSGVDKEGWSL